MNPIQKFLQKIDNIVSAIGSAPETEVNEIKTNLVASVYLDLTAKIGLDPKNKVFLDQMADDPPKTVEEMNRSIKLTQEKLKKVGFDTEAALAESLKSVLEGFVSKVEPKLSPEKAVEVKKIATE